MKRKILTVLLLIFAGLLSLYLREKEEFTKNGTAMNTLVRVTVFADDADVLDEAFGLIDALDRKLSMYNPSSDLSYINVNSGVKAVSVDNDTVSAVNDALRLYNITGGVFNPLIGAVTRLWKINQSEGALPSNESLDYAVQLADINNLHVSGSTVYLKRKGCVLDLGGVAKGYSSTKTAQFLKTKNIKSAVIDLGGNVHVVGSKPDGTDWNIGIRNPLRPFGEPALVVRVKDCAVITSGNYERFKNINGKKYSHFFDPLTGKSIMSDLLSVTVISPDGSLADGLATAFMIIGVDKALDILKAMDNPPAVIFITQDRIIATQNAKPLILRSLIQPVYAEAP